jgi:hypothetical protein
MSSGSSSSDEDDGKKSESGSSTEDGVPHQARATVEPTPDEVVEPKDLLEEIDEAKKNELTPKKSKSSGTHDESGLSRDSPNKRLLSRLAHAGQDYPDLEHTQQQMKEMWDTSWDGLDEDELKARHEKYEALNAQMIEGTKRLIAERDTFAAASATLGQKADERGDDTRDLAKIVKNMEKETNEPGSSELLLLCKRSIVNFVICCYKPESRASFVPTCALITISTIERLSAEPSDAPDHLIYPFSYNLMGDPVIDTASGLTFDRPWLERWIGECRRTRVGTYA